MVWLQHAYREANNGANHLTERGKDQVYKIREYTHCLTFVQQAVLLDMMD